MFAQERFFFLETTWNEDPGIVLLYSTDEPITGVIYDTTFGYLRWEENYLNGIKNGIQRRYNESGELSVEENYINGEKDGLWIYYNNQTIWRKIYFSDGLDTTLIDYYHGKDNQLIRKETRNRDSNLDKYALWWPKPMRLAYNTIETFHNLYDCKGIFCNKQKHFEFILDFDTIDCSQKPMFLQSADHKIQEYKLFISKHMRHEFTSKAKEDLLTLKEERDYKLAKRMNRTDGYNEFLSLYPSSKKNQEGYKDGTLERIILIDLITEYNNILNLNSVEAWEDFLSKYPTNCNICMSDRVYEDAKYYLSFSKDLNAWAKASDEGTYESYSEYLVNFTPLRYNGANREIALDRIDSLVEPEWEKNKKKNSIITYREFIERYPNSSFIDLAYEAAWKKAKDKNRITYYERYLDNFSDGKHGNEVLKAMLELEMSIEAANKNIISGVLPSELPVYKDYNIASTEHRFIVKNATRDLGKKTPQTLLVSYRGVKKEGGSLKGNYIIKIDECKEIILPSGSYFFEFESKDDKTITKYRNIELWEFIGGYYSSGGYIYVQNTLLGVPVPENPSDATYEMLKKKYNECAEIKH